MLPIRLYPAAVKSKQLNNHNLAFSSLNKTTSTFKVTLVF